MQIFLFELAQNPKKIISDKQKKRKNNGGNVKSVCDQKRNSYGIYKKHFIQDVYTLYIARRFGTL